MKQAIKNHLPTAQALTKLLHPFAEVVLHDLASDQIVAIFNPFSRREIGDCSYLDSAEFSGQTESDIIGPYEKINYDGRKLKSISIVIRDDAQKAVGFLCINMDISMFENYQHCLQAFLATDDKPLSTKQAALFKDDLYDQINRFVQEDCRARQLSPELLGREEKCELIERLKAEGALKGKNAAQYIARVLNISRATVYNYLREIN